MDGLASYVSFSGPDKIMAAKIKVNLLDFNTNVVEEDLYIISGNYARNLSTVGKITIRIPNIYPPGYFGRDNILAVYRQPVGGGMYLEPGALWFIRKVSIASDANELVIEGVDQMDLLRRRLVAYNQETIYAEKIFDWGTGPDFADDLMKDFVNENMGTAAVFPLSLIHI